MKNIILLTDYKNNFGQKYTANPYRSGMDKELLREYFSDFGFKVQFQNMSKIDFNSSAIAGETYIYTSSEDVGYHYKNFIEDIVLGIEQKGGIIIPGYKYLRANNNKVYMEILRKCLQLPNTKLIQSQYFGTLEEMLDVSDTVGYPIVFKLSEGSSGSNVELAHSKSELESIIKKYSRTRNLKKDLRDFVRAIKRSGYKKESLFRKKYILQSFIPNLQNDWKVYVFHDKYFTFYRPVFKHRKFKASGGGYKNYHFGLNSKLPDGLLDFAKNVFKNLNVPNASLDIGYDGKTFYLFEFQCIYFGNAGIIYSDEYFMLKDGKWNFYKNDKNIEKTYVESIVKYIECNKV